MDSMQEGFQHCTRMEQPMPFEHHQMIANFSFESQSFQIVRQCIDYFAETNRENGANFLMPVVVNEGNSIFMWNAWVVGGHSQLVVQLTKPFTNHL